MSCPAIYLQSVEVNMESVGPVRALTTGKEKSSAPKKTKVKVIVRARPSLSCEGNDCCIKICQEVGGEIVERKGAVGNILELRNHKVKLLLNTDKSVFHFCKGNCPDQKISQVPGDILKYSFDACYDKDATQEEIFTNVCILAGTILSLSAQSPMGWGD